MPRRPRLATAGLIFHIVNRAARKAGIFDTWADYQAFEGILVKAIHQGDVEVFAYCVMPNHWHLLISPRSDEALSRFMHWLTTTHARRWRGARGTDGQGAVYQGRFKSIPIQDDTHFLWVARYVERNALRAGLARRAEAWPWSSLWQRQNNPDATWLGRWPVNPPSNWVTHVNEPQTPAELDAFRRACVTGNPFGDDDWRALTRRRMGLRPHPTTGRPRKVTPDPLMRR
jgi:putative transposase